MNSNKSDTYETLYDKFQTFVLKKSEASQALNISIQTLDRMRKAGEIRTKRIHGGIYIDIRELANYIDQL